MNKRIATLLAMLSAAFFVHGQTPSIGSGQAGWTAVDKMIQSGSYSSAYAKAAQVYGRQDVPSRERLTAAYYMARAAAEYQEDARDSAEARYRALLPVLDSLDCALCHAFLGQYDSALRHEALLQSTPVARVKPFAERQQGKDGGQNVTPTVYDMLVVMMQERGELTPQERVDWQRRLCAFHADDADDGLRLWHEVRLLEMLSAVPNRPLADSVVLDCLARYGGTKSEYITELHYMMARHCRARGELVDAVRWCDSAIARYPKSRGGVECLNMRSSITAASIEPSMEVHFLSPGREELMGVTYRNLGELHLRLVEEPDENMDDRQLWKLKALKEWSVALPLRDDYTSASAAFALPPLSTGRYRLLMAPTRDFKKGVAYTELHVTDIALRYTNDGRGLVVDRISGAPVASQPMELLQATAPTASSGGSRRVLQTVVTAADGTYRFDTMPQGNSIVRAVRDGYTIELAFYGHGRGAADTSRTSFHMVSDRPVYRLGDTAQVAILLYRSNGRDGHLLAAGHTFEALLYAPNGQQVRQFTLTTDDYGSVHCAFLLPQDHMPGYWSLRVHDSTGQGSMMLRVEEYKQPRFTVSLDADGQMPSFGTPCTVQGMATAYSGYSLGGARVQYTVTRMFRRWRWGSAEASTTVAQGETETAADGTFSLTFLPEPDSSIELTRGTVFTYNVQVTVTDLNGESHDASTAVRIGFRNRMLQLKGIEPSLRELPSVAAVLTDLGGNSVQGRVEVSVERLHRPDSLRLRPAVLIRGTHQTLSRDEYRRRFPHYAYDIAENDRRLWPAEWRWQGEVVDGTAQLPPLQGGIYRIVAQAVEGTDTVADTAYTLLVPPADRRSHTDAVLWVDQDKAAATPGQSVTFRLGTAFEGVKTFYWIEYGERKTLASGWLTLGRELQEVTVDVDSTMLGGFTLTAVTVCHGQAYSVTSTVQVPYTHKQLKVSIATFRDRLQPGEQEQWTISLRGTQPVVGTLVMTMYDDALNSYGRPSWMLAPWRNHSTVWQTLYDPYFSFSYYHGSTWHSYRGTYPTVWSLNDALPGYSRWRGPMMYKTAAARNAAVGMDEGATLDAVVQTSALGAIEEDVEEEEAIFSVVEKEPEMQLRSNLSTLAFFAPALRTAADGTLTYRFVVPEMLTRWNVRALALSRDLKSGLFDSTLVTRKPLMVQPNMPRFMRSGDSLSLTVKVVLAEPVTPFASDGGEDITVAFLLTDAATGDTICHHTELVHTADAAQVRLDVVVPQGVHVVTYRITAHADGMSDGEQGQVPVLDSRQTVTVSRALYNNGIGEKRFTMPEWLDGDGSREPLRASAEVVSNPIMLALKCMPYFKSLENPSTPYLASQLYVDSRGLDILSTSAPTASGTGITVPAASGGRIPIQLQATPWTHDDISDNDQTANYFDSASLAAVLHKTAAELAARQNADGGWGWMPGGKSSLWVTQEVLKRLPTVASSWLDGKQQMIDKALKYIDREQQRDYEQMLKVSKSQRHKEQWQPINIDYLYTRSFYGKARTEAYKFYYANALKNYHDYDALYTQAQLALVFYRHGDRRQALDLLRRLKEKALVDDEMGMYWRDNRGGWCWHQRPIETQALLIQAFAAITPDDDTTIALMQQWLLKQKQATHWGNERATTDAIAALMVNQDAYSADTGCISLSVFGQELNSATGSWTGTALDSLRLLADSTIVLRKETGGIAWGAVYYQFADEMEKIPVSETGITLKRSYLRLVTDSSAARSPLKPGDRLRVRLDITCDRTMEYLELIDGRPSCVEPVSTRSGWQWSGGLGCYVVVGNSDTRYYFERLDRGSYRLEYEVYVTNHGRALAAPVIMQCMYAPEFRAVLPGEELKIKN